MAGGKADKNPFISVFVKGVFTKKKDQKHTQVNALGGPKVHTLKMGAGNELVLPRAYPRQNLNYKYRMKHTSSGWDAVQTVGSSPQAKHSCELRTEVSVNGAIINNTLTQQAGGRLQPLLTM